MNEQPRPRVTRPRLLLVAVLCVLGLSAATCDQESGGESQPAPEGEDTEEIAIPTAAPGQVSDSDDVVPAPTLVAPGPEGTVDDTNDPGTADAIVDQWWDLFRTGQLDALDEQVGAADPSTLSEEIAVFDVLIAMARNEGVAASDMATVERLAQNLDRLDPTLAEGVAEAVELTKARAASEPEVVDG